MTMALAAAGTGGHVYPALAVADALVAAGTGIDEIVFFGGDRMEAETIPAAGYEFVRVDMSGLRRSLSPANLRLPGMIRRATVRITEEMARRRVGAVGVFGGYVSVPAALAARRSGAAIVVHEQNAHPGLANRLISPRASRTLVGFPAAKQRLKRARVVGNPLRTELAAFDRGALRAAALERYGLKATVPVLGVIGGSLGAKVLNDTVARIAADAEPEGLAIVHLTGSIHEAEMAPLANRSGVRWVVTAFESDMQYFYAAADLVLGRAGALTVSELTSTGTPAVLVPLEATHQAANAVALESAGGALVVPQSDLNRIPVEVQQLMFDGSNLERMAKAAADLAADDAAGSVARELIEVHRG